MSEAWPELGCVECQAAMGLSMELARGAKSEARRQWDRRTETRRPMRLVHVK